MKPLKIYMQYEELKKENAKLKQELSEIYSPKDPLADMADEKSNKPNPKIIDNTQHSSSYFTIRRERLAYIFLLIVLLIGILNLVGWLLRYPLFTSLFPYWTSTKPSASFCFAISALSVIFLQQRDLSRLMHFLISLFGLIIILVGLFSIISFIIDVNGNENPFGFSPLLNSFLKPESRMALMAAIQFILIGFILMMLVLKKPITQEIASALALMVFIVSYFVPVGYILGITSVYTIHQSSMAFYAGINFCILCVAILLFYPETWFMKVFVERYAGGNMARKLVPGIIIIPLIFGWLRIRGEKAGLFSSDIGVVLLIVAFTFCFLFLVWMAAKSVIKIGAKQRALDASLNRSEKQYRQLVESANNIIMRLDINGTFKFVNEYTLDFFGYTREEIIGKSVGLIIPETESNGRDLKPLRNNILKYVENFPQNENENIKKSGERAWIMWTNRIIRDSQNNPIEILTIGNDATEKKQAEEALKESEESFSIMFKSLSIGVSLLKYPGLVMHDVNKAWINLMGFSSKEEVVGKTVTELGGLFREPEIRDRNLKELYEKGFLRNAETEIITKKGDKRIISVNLDLVYINGQRYILSTMPDITELKKAQVIIKQSEEMFSAMVSVLPIAVVLSNFSDRKIYKVNPAFLKISEYTEEEIIGKTPEDLGMLKDLELQKIYFDDFRQTGKVRNFEMTFFTKKGVSRIFSINMDPLNIREQSFILITGEDITEQKRIENEIKQKNEELTRFIYTVSHDLKSPLVTIKTFAGYLEEDISKQDKVVQLKDIQYINNAADKMGSLLNELLELSRIGKKDDPKSEVLMKTIAQEAVDLVAGRIAQRNVKKIFTGPDIMLYGHQQRLLQLYQNLIDNSVKFMGNQPEPVIEIGSDYDHAKNQVTLFVRDNGAGIDPKYQDKVFGLFEKLNSKTEGTGIGLALIKRIVEVHGGSIHFSSEGEEKGTTFYFTLEGTHVLQNVDRA